MNIRDAILKAADHIESHPEEFDFHSVDRPGCGTPGCALGWIGVFGEVTKPAGRSWLGAVSDYIAVDSVVFYQRMSELDGYWTVFHDSCARALRAYADKYHPAESRSLIPESVRVIFTMTHAELAREFDKTGL
jgi:hypothetical protein